MIRADIRAGLRDLERYIEGVAKEWPTASPERARVLRELETLRAAVRDEKATTALLAAQRVVIREIAFWQSEPGSEFFERACAAERLVNDLAKCVVADMQSGSLQRRRGG